MVRSISEKLKLPEKLTALIQLKERLGDQKIDLVVTTTEKVISDPSLKSVSSKALLIR